MQRERKFRQSVVVRSYQACDCYSLPPSTPLLHATTTLGTRRACTTQHPYRIPRVGPSRPSRNIPPKTCLRVWARCFLERKPRPPERKYLMSIYRGITARVDLALAAKKVPCSDTKTDVFWGTAVISLSFPRRCPRWPGLVDPRYRVWYGVISVMKYYHRFCHYDGTQVYNIFGLALDICR